MENIEITKQNGNIAFEEKSHKYWDVTDPSKKFISVTTIIEKFGQPYDKEFWSSYKALEKLLSKDAWEIEKQSLLKTKKFDKSLLKLHDISENDFNREQQAILDKWDLENKKSCERGTKIHADLENSFYKKKKDIDISKYQIGGTFECRKDYTDLDLENAVYPEYLIHRVTPDGKLCIAGQIDLLVKKGNHITIGDWKGLPLDTKIPTITGWTTMKGIEVGDVIFDRDGEPCKVINKSEVHLNPCYKITFDDGTTVVADHEHKWDISFMPEKNITDLSSFIHKVMTTEEIAEYLEALDIEDACKIPRILNPKPLKLPAADLVIKPYALGRLVGDPLTGSSFRIPDVYKRASTFQRQKLLKGLMAGRGFRHSDGTYSITVNTEQTRKDVAELLAGLGIKYHYITNNSEYVIHFSIFKSNNINDAFRTIIKVEKVDTIPTQCIEVDSPSHTYLFSEKMIVTHNTNKKIETKSYFDRNTKSSVKMKFPLNTLDDCNYYHYALQLSTYAWMMQKLNHDFIIDDLVLVHFDHSDNMTVYHLPYLKKEVEKMLAFYKKELQLEENARKRKRIEY